MSPPTRARGRLTLARVGLTLTLTCLNGLPALAAGGALRVSPPALPEHDPKLPFVPAPDPPVQFPQDGELTDALQELDVAILSALQHASESGRGWQQLASAASLYMRRARLSGSYDDYANAEAALERAFLRAPEHGGPIELRAQLNFSLHRLPRVDEDLAQMERRILQDNEYKARRVGLAADVAFQRGRYAAAREGFAEALALDRDISSRSRMAVYLWKTGSFDQAEQLYDEATASQREDVGTTAAWLHLQRGLMDLERGRYEDALGHYRLAERALPGYWLVEEHIAEILTLLGQTDDALALYHDIIARTNNAEFMDAVAGILRERGDELGARAMIDRARAIYEKQLARYPEAAYGHALEHFLEFGSQERALTLARENHALRPGADAKILLAQALLGAGEVKEARARIDEALASPIRTADLHRTAAAVARAEGDETGALAQEALARAINPRALE